MMHSRGCIVAADSPDDKVTFEQCYENLIRAKPLETEQILPGHDDASVPYIGDVSRLPELESEPDETFIEDYNELKTTVDAACAGNYILALETFHHSGLVN